MRGDPVSYVLQVLVGRESEYKQVRLARALGHTFHNEDCDTEPFFVPEV